MIVYGNNLDNLRLLPIFGVLAKFLRKLPTWLSAGSLARGSATKKRTKSRQRNWRKLT